MVKSLGKFKGPMREIVHSLKYQRNLALGDFFAPFMANIYYQQKWQADIVIPVPLHKNRLRERGYNQAEILARPFAQIIGVPYERKAIIRLKDTRSQVGLKLIERRENMKAAFSADPKKVGNLKILVIDDVATTTATIDACANALIKANAAIVYGLTLARAVRIGDDQITR